MGFDEEIERLANRMRNRGKYSAPAIEKVTGRFKERYNAGDFSGWAWNEVAEDFIDAVRAATPPKSKPYRSGKRSSK